MKKSILLLLLLTVSVTASASSEEKDVSLQRIPTVSNVPVSYGFDEYAKAVKEALDVEIAIPQGYIERKTGTKVYFQTPNTAIHPVEDYSVSVVSEDGNTVLLLSDLRIEADMKRYNVKGVAKRDICAAMYHETISDYVNKFGETNLDSLMEDVSPLGFNAGVAYWVSDLPIDKSEPCEFKRCAGIYLQKKNHVIVMIKVLSKEDVKIDKEKSIKVAQQMFKYGNGVNWKIDQEKWRKIPRL